ncbi:MAG: DsbA family protein [Flavobacterium sp.]|uniref:DsbA family protein n=1 Tax=Flavobacterium sp. TaxID=239 RepID=UPI0025B81B99|nr:DsbA family protein [Flavobacterium sp.]MCK6607040.1 DsbA family protein [Flavobacterium sp.]
MATIMLVACSFQPKKKEMEKVKIIYVYDAICGWCFGFSPTMAKLKTYYQDKIDFEVVSGGLKLGKGAGPIDVVAPYIKTSYTDVESTCGVKFGDAFVNETLKKGTMVLNSLPPAIALSIMKEKYPDKSLEFAGLLHKMYYVDGIEPENYEAYGIYAAKLGYDKTDFNKKMMDSVYIKKAYQEFEYAEELEAFSFPTVLIEIDGKKEILFQGFVTFDRAKKLIDSKILVKDSLKH